MGSSHNLQKATDRNSSQ